MNLTDYSDQDGKKVWLSEKETGQLLDVVDDSKQKLAMGISVRCGLRTDEIVRVCPKDAVETVTEMMPGLHNGPAPGKYQATPPFTVDRIRSGPACELPVRVPITDYTVSGSHPPSTSMFWPEM